jgi:uncharacterized peroxidase-related enzyme
MTPPPAATATPVTDFTLDALEWVPHVTPVDLTQATPNQREALQVTPSNTQVSAYVLTLALDPEILKERTPLFNDIMYGRGGLSRAERELGALGASVVNHCVYCAAVHANRFNQLTKRPEIVDAVYRDGPDARLPARDQAILDFSVRLTREPQAMAASDLGPLREAGLTDAEILDLIHSVAIFGWANRLMHTLGQPYKST